MIDSTLPDTGMNAAVRAVTRMGIYVGAKVYLIYEVNRLLHNICILWLLQGCGQATMLLLSVI